MSETKKMKVSASQIKTYKLCPKKWYFQSVDRLPRGNGTASTRFGTALHACLERYIDGEDELFPVGYDEGVAAEDKEALKFLPTTAIEDNIVVRFPDAISEQAILFPLTPTVDCGGFVDLTIPHKNEIEDYKTTRNPKYYLSENPKSKLYFGKDTQMVLYGYDYLQRNKEVTEVRLTHTNLNPKMMHIKRRSVMIPRQEIEDYVKKEIIPVVNDMEKDSKLNSRVAESQLEPKSFDACSAFRGCEFLDICSGTCSKTQYRERFDEVIPVEKTVEIKSEKKEEPKMSSYLDKLKARRLAADKEETPVVEAKAEETKADLVEAKEVLETTSEVEVVPEVEVEGEELVEETTPGTLEEPNSEQEFKIGDQVSWTNSAKKVLDGEITGFKDDETAFCRQQGKARGASVLISALSFTSFDVDQLEEPTLEDQSTPVDVAKVEETKADLVEAKEPVVVAGKESEPTSSGFTVYLNCAPTQVKHAARFITIQRLFDIVIENIAADAGKSYWDLDAFKRREIFIRNIDTIITEAGMETISGVLVSGVNTESRQLVDALISRADMVIQGTVG